MNVWNARIKRTNHQTDDYQIVSQTADSNYLIVRKVFIRGHWFQY